MSHLFWRLIRPLIKRKLRSIGDVYPQTLDELILWHDLMAIECLERPSQERLLGVMVQTADELDKLKKPQGGTNDRH